MAAAVPIVALTGGIATGKTTVAQMFRDHGIPVIDADQLARQAVELGSPGLNKITAVFGQEVVDENGELKNLNLTK